MIHLVMASDDNYMHHMAAAAVSCVVNTTMPITFHILSNNISDENKRAFTESVKSLGKGAAVRFTECDCSSMNIRDQVGHVSQTTNARYLIPDLLPPEVDKALYLDTDLIVRHDLVPLWTTDISDYLLAAAIEPDAPWNYLKYRFPKGMPLLNAGVLLMNLKKMRETGFLKNVMKYASETGYDDQVALNKRIAGNFKQIDPTYNAVKSYFRIYYGVLCSSRRARKFRRLVKDPAILHATGKKKLCDKTYQFPFGEEFYKYLAMTAWKDFKPDEIGLFDKALVWTRRKRVAILDKIRDWSLS